MSGERNPGIAHAETEWDMQEIAAGLSDARADWRAQHRRHAEHGQAGFPSRRKLEAILADLSGALFPLRL